QSASSVSIGAAEMFSPASLLSTPLQLETLVNEIRSEHLEWRVLTELKLYESHAFVRNFAARFPGFDPAKPAPEAQDYLLRRFNARLRVRTVPRTMLIQIDFRSKDPVFSAAVVDALIRDYSS